jgi:ABC-type uncharacterized transport system substrate-binding protein
VLNATSGREIDEVFASLRREPPDVLLVAGSPFFNTRRVQLAVAAGRSGIPAMYVGRQYVEAGGLISYGASILDAYRQQGVYIVHRLPAVYPYRYYVTSGGLACYGPDTVDQFRQAAGYVDRILRGEKPGELPVQAPTRYQMVINLKAARALGLEIPPTFLARADEVIE